MDVDPNQTYRQHETEKKHQYVSWILEVEQATFTPLVFSMTGGMAVECKWYHSRLAELDAAKKGEGYATTMSWIRARVSFALLRSALLCLRGSGAKRRIHLELSDIDFNIEKGHANIRWKTVRMIFYFLLFINFLRFPHFELDIVDLIILLLLYQCWF